MDQYRTNRKEIRQKLREIETCSRVFNSSRRWVQVVIKANQYRGPKVLFAFRDHARRITPDHNFEFSSEGQHRCSERANPLFVVFQDENRLHSTTHVSSFRRQVVNEDGNTFAGQLSLNYLADLAPGAARQSAPDSRHVHGCTQPASFICHLPQSDA
jgi:hypothetical protein